MEINWIRVRRCRRVARPPLGSIEAIWALGQFSRLARMVPPGRPELN